jgi:hypothetical protein
MFSTQPQPDPDPDPDPDNIITNLPTIQPLPPLPPNSNIQELKAYKYLQFDYGLTKLPREVHDFIAPTSSYITSNTFLVVKLSDFSIERLSVLLCKILSEIEGINYNYTNIPLKYTGFAEDTFSIEFEYGTLPKSHTLTPYQLRLYNEFINNTLFDAVIKAQDLFPHNNPYIDENEDYDEPIKMMVGISEIRKWCKTKIRISFDSPFPEEALIEFSRISGDRWANQWIFMYVIERLNTELLWNSRKKHISLMEGCPDETGQIIRYIFDEYVVREIFTFMELAPKVSTVLSKEIRDLRDYHFGVGKNSY